MRKLKMPGGLDVLVDDDLYIKLKLFNWHQCGECDFAASMGGVNVTLGRFILGVWERDMIVVHKNGRKYDYRRENLIATPRGRAKSNIGAQAWTRRWR